MEISLAQALAWRMQRHYLLAGAGSVLDVVRRLTAVPAWSGNPELAIGRRLHDARSGSVQDALGNGELIRTYAFRGATHLMAAQEAGIYLSVRGANRQWELPSWRAYYGLEPADWDVLRTVVRAAVAAGPIEHLDLVDRVTAVPRFRHLRGGLLDASHTLLKPLGWQGDLCFGPVRNGRATFQSPTLSPYWADIPPLDEAGPRAVLGYLAAYGPATLEQLRYWLVAGLSAGQRRLDKWLVQLTGDLVVEVQVSGRTMFHAREHLDTLIAQQPTTAVRLLPGYDQWVLGAGTANEAVVHQDRRTPVTRGANLVIHGGRVAGTWRLDSPRLVILWFREAGEPPQSALHDEAELLGHKIPPNITVG